MHNPVCTQCGECCRGDTTDIMIYENLTPEQRDTIWKPRTKDVCCMLVDNLCRIELEFGHEAKPDICKQVICKREMTKGYGLN